MKSHNNQARRKKKKDQPPAVPHIRVSSSWSEQTDVAHVGEGDSNTGGLIRLPEANQTLTGPKAWRRGDQRRGRPSESSAAWTWSSRRQGGVEAAQRRRG